MRRLADLVVRWPWAVIGVWVAIAVALPLTFPSLNEMAQRHPLAILPSDAPSSVAARQMTEAFHESGSDNLLVVAFINESGLKPADEAAYRKVVDALRGRRHRRHDGSGLLHHAATAPVPDQQGQDDLGAAGRPCGRDGHAPRPTRPTTGSADLVKHNVAADGPLKVHVTGPAATVADLTVAGEQDRLPIEIAIAVLVLLVLLVVYRNPVTMLLPLAAIGASLVIAQAVVAGVSDLFGLGVSNQSMIFLSAMIAGAGTDYAVFLISRYHDYLRQGADLDDAVRRALISIGKVITASAATVGVTFLGHQLRQDGRVLHDRCGVRDRGRGGIPGRDDVAARHSGAGRAARLGQTAPRTHRPVLATFGGPHRATAEGPSGRQPARPGHSRRLRELGALQLRRSQGPWARRRRVRSGTPRWNAISPSARPCPSTSSSSHRATCARRRPSRTWSRWRSGSANCRTSASSAASPDPPERCRRSSGPPIKRASSAIGWPQGSAVISDNSKDLNRLQNGAGTLAASLGDVRAQINESRPACSV